MSFKGGDVVESALSRTRASSEIGVDRDVQHVKRVRIAEAHLAAHGVTISSMAGLHSCMQGGLLRKEEGLGQAEVGFWQS